MAKMNDRTRFLAGSIPAHLKRPLAKLQPVLAKKGGELNIDLKALARQVEGVATVAEPIAIESPEHWARVISGLDCTFDAILPVSIAAYPTEIWNSHPQPLVERGLPVVFWPIIKYDEPDFWRWSARDMLTSLDVEVHLVKNAAAGLALCRSLAMRRFLEDSKLVVFGLQNFPWNAHAAGHLVTEGLGTQIVVRTLADMRRRYAEYSDAQVDAFWKARKGSRYVEKDVKPADLRQAIRTYFGIKEILEEERALGFGVNCFGELITQGGRDVPCLAQTLLREDGYIASCDGDFLAMMSMVLATFMLDKTAVMSNMYPIQYVGALTDHFGDPLTPDPKKYSKKEWPNLARIAHCGFVGVVSPEMSPRGSVSLNDWGGTYEIKRDGRGCGIDGELAGGEKITVLELKFDGQTLLIADAEVAETTRHKNMRHCESTALLRFRDLQGFVANISREHTAIVYGDHVADMETLAKVLGLEAMVF